METAVIDNLLPAAQCAQGLIGRGASVAEIRIKGRARPAVMLDRPPYGQQLYPVIVTGTLAADAIPPASWSPTETRYAWGVDARGRWERHCALVDGVQVIWEQR